MLLYTTIRQSPKRCLGRWLSNLQIRPISMMDPTQEAALKEKCFLVDDKDKIIGTASKKDCHVVKDGTVPLHRAFSVFLFNSKGDLLLQKRADTKITYPGHYTNSCCSHPLADFAGEDEEKDAIGIKRAAVRRLNYELGIPVESIPIDKLNYVTRIKYMDPGDGKWGENEISYILFLQSDVPVHPNPNEISAISIVPKNEFSSFIHSIEGPLTPWFSLMLKHRRLKIWWEHLDNLKEIKDHEHISDLGRS